LVEDASPSLVEDGTPAPTKDAAQPTVDAGADGLRQLRFVNRCTTTIWVGALTGKASYVLPANGGFQLPPGETHTVPISGEWGGRFWGRTGCTFDRTGKGTCQTGDCGGREECGGIGGKPPATLAEFFFPKDTGDDFYDVSLVDGYNLPVGIAPRPGTFTRKNSQSIYDCGHPSCVSDLNDTCPADLQQKASSGDVIACLSACERFNTDEYCCRGAHSTPETCPATSYSEIFKAACPTAYSYAYDDKTSTFTCQGEDYDITFCP
jgi:hypothetical protein